MLLSESSNQYTKRPMTNGSNRPDIMATPLAPQLSGNSTVPVEMETNQILKVAKNNIDRLQSEYSDKVCQPIMIVISSY